MRDPRLHKGPEYLARNFIPSGVGSHHQPSFEARLGGIARPFPSGPGFFIVKETNMAFSSMHEGIWQCEGCGQIYPEYVNGCVEDHEPPRAVVLRIEEP